MILTGILFTSIIFLLLCYMFGRAVGLGRISIPDFVIVFLLLSAFCWMMYIQYFATTTTTPQLRSKTITRM